MTRRTITVSDGVELATRVDGEGDAPPLLCANSLGTGHELWEPQAPGWSVERPVLRFDQRGHGGSGVPPAPYTIDRLGQDAVEVLDAHEVERADVCGLSLGGLVALWVAIVHPERVRRLVLACTDARVGTRESWEERAALVRDGGTAAIADAVMERFFSPGFRTADPETVARARADLVATPDEGYVGSCLALAEADLRDRVSRVTCPVLVIAGSEDEATPPAQVRGLHDALGDARWLEIDGAGHLANLERPGDFEAAVTRFLTDG